MSRTILALSTVALLCASSQIAFADEAARSLEGLGAPSPVLLLAVRSPDNRQLIPMVRVGIYLVPLL